jgi:hypothetical protein
MIENTAHRLQATGCRLLRRGHCPRITAGHLLLAALQLLSISLALAEDRRAIVCDEAPFDATVTAVDANWKIDFQTGDKLRSVAASELVRWGTPAPVPPRSVVVLASGAILVADVVSGDRNQLTADSALAGTIAFPWESLAAAVFHAPADAQRLDALLDQAARGGGTSDRLLLVNSDEVTGLVETIDNEKVHVQTELGPVDIETERVAAIVFRSSGRPASDPASLRVWTGLRDGSRLPAQTLSLVASSMTITLPGGITVRVRPEDLVWLQPVGGKAVYLSDLKPIDYRHVPFLSLAWPYRLDRSVQNRWLRCDRQTYLKGLGVHSAARLSYLLSEPFRRFEAEVGIDDETAGAGSVRFRVFIDGQQKYTSPILRGGQKPTSVVLDLTGVKRLDLVVDFADRADEQDHADWLDARLIR